MTPQLVDTGKVYSIKPENRRGDFDFTRASAATRVGADGNIEKETSNLLLQSNSFLTSWVRTGYTLTSGQGGYDGTNNAWLAECTSAGQALYQTSNASGVSTLSFHLKQGTANFLRLRADQSADPIAVFDLSDGSVNSFNGNVIDTNVVDLGSGWYRCSMTWNIDTLSNVQVRAEDGNGSPILGTFYIQDPQLNQGLIAQEVITTTTTALYGGITDNTPRLDYTDSSCPALLLEPQRTNLMTSSEYFQAPYWSETGIGSVQNNVSIIADPTGNYGASKIIPDSTNTTAHAIIGNDVSTSTQYTVSIFAKAAEYDYLLIRGLGLGGGGGARFNISTGVVEGFLNFTSASIEDYGNGWYRCIATGTTPPATTTGPFYHPSPTASYTAYAGSGTSGIYTWGAQVEAAAFATSIIPTYGTSVTRVAGTCGDAGDITMINSTEGVLYAEIAALTQDNTSVVEITLNDGSSSNRVAITFTTSNNALRTLVRVGGVNQFNTTSSLSNITEYKKIAIKYKANDFALWVNGIELDTDTNGTTFSALTLNNLSFNNGSGSSDFFGKVNALQVYKEALTDAELATLTTI